MVPPVGLTSHGQSSTSRKDRLFWRSPKHSVDTEVHEMNVTLAASTGSRIDVWREEDLFHARRADHVTEPQTCLS
jgi:hypothetical protein